jgi:hypothetical protein
MNHNIQPFFYKKKNLKKLFFVVILFNLNINVISDDFAIKFLRNKFPDKLFDDGNSLSILFLKKMGDKSLLEFLGFIKTAFRKLGLDPQEICVSHGKGEFSWKNFIFFHQVVIPNYLEFFDDAARQIGKIFLGDRSVIDEINEAKNIKIKENNFYFIFRNWIFSSIFSSIYKFSLGFNLVYNGIILILNYYLSILVQLKLSKNTQQNMDQLIYQAPSEENPNDIPENKINHQDMFNIFIKPFDPNIKFELFIKNLTYRINDHKLMEIEPNQVFLRFLLINTLRLGVSAFIQQLINWGISYFVGDKRRYKPQSLLNLISKDDKYFKNFGVSKEVCPTINYYHHFMGSVYLYWMKGFYFLQSKYLGLILKSILEKTESKYRDTPINFDQREFPVSSLRYFFLDSQKNKKKLFQLLKKWNKLFKKSSVDFKNKFPSESLIILGEIGAGKTSLLNLVGNYVEIFMVNNKIVIEKAIFSGRVPALKNLLKKDELREVILKALQKAFKSNVNLIIIEESDQVLPNRSNNINIASYMSINTYLINVNVGEGNAEKGYAGVILGTAQKAKNLDSAVIRRSSFVIVNNRNKKRLKKIIALKYLLTELQNTDDNFEKYFIVKKIKSSVKKILEVARFQETYRMHYLMSKSVLYLKYFNENLSNIGNKILEQKREVDEQIIGQWANGNDDFNGELIYGEFDGALLNYCSVNNVFNNDLIDLIFTEVSTR